MHPSGAEGMANSVDSDQTVVSGVIRIDLSHQSSQEQSDVCLHYLPRPVFPHLRIVMVFCYFGLTIQCSFTM